MNLKLTLAALMMASLALTACSKKEDTAKNDTATDSAVVEKVSPAQQAAIDSIDPPILDEKNTDVPAHIANADTDQASATVEQSASEATAP